MTVCFDMPIKMMINCRCDRYVWKEILRQLQCMHITCMPTNHAQYVCWIAMITSIKPSTVPSKFDRPMKQNLKIKIEIKWLLTPLLHISGLPQHRSIFKGHRFIAQTSLAIDITKPTLGCTVLDRGRKWAQAWSHSLGLVWEQPWSWYN